MPELSTRSTLEAEKIMKGGAPSEPESAPPREAANLETAGAGPERPGNELRELRRVATSVAREAWGRGPERCEAHWAGADLLVVVFHGGLTASEATLKQAGEDVEVLRCRETFRRSVEPPLRAAIARLTGRGVIAELGVSHLDPDLTIEVFVLSRSPGSVQQAEAMPGALEAAWRSAEERISESSAVTAQAIGAVRRARKLREARRDRRGEPPKDD